MNATDVRAGRFAHLARLAQFATCCLVAACSGGTDGDAPEQRKPEVVALSGVAYLGETGLISNDNAVRVTGSAGFDRTVLFTGPYAYTAKLDELDGPYAAGLQFNSEATGELSYIVGLSTASGVANVTPLTTLVVAEALGVDPGLYFRSLSPLGDPALLDVTDAQLAVGEERTRRYLRQTLGITVPESIENFTTTPFSAAAGDPMFDTITAFNAALAERGTNILALSRSLAAEATLCNAEDVSITAGDALIDFCPKFKTALPDDADSSLVDYRFTASAGEVLTVSARGADVASVTYADAAGRLSTCRDAACAGTSIGDAAGDGSRSIVFDVVALSGAAGRLLLDGLLQSAPKGAALPPLPCDTNRYYLIHPDNTVAATCAQGDSFGLGIGAGDTLAAGDVRRIYTFQSDGSVDPVPASIEIRADDQRVASVVVWQYGESGIEVLNKCVGTGCSGVTIGPANDDTTTVPPYTLRTRSITLTDTVLPAVDASGTPSTTEFVTIRASFTSLELIEPPANALAVQPCASPQQRLLVDVSDEEASIPVCPPADPIGFPPEGFLKTTADGGGGVRYLINSLYANEFGSAVYVEGFGGVVIETVGGAVTKVTFGEFSGNGVVYACTGAGCVGVTIGEPNADGEVFIALSGTVLTEVELGGLPGTRTAAVDGSFVAPPPPTP